MRLVTWNCQGAFRKKAKFILEQRPDILVIQECENTDKFLFNSDILNPNDFLWKGDNEHKGIVVFSFGTYKLRLLDNYNPEIKYILPILVTSESFEFILLAVWANNPKDPDGCYVEQIWKAVNYYEIELLNERLILVGDFNSNKIWDKPKRIGNHSAVVEKLKKNQIFSVYHSYFAQQQGFENHPTFFLQRNMEKPYHIDYCFASNLLLESVRNFEVGSFEKWISYSDHVPLTVDFDETLIMAHA